MTKFIPLTLNEEESAAVAVALMLLINDGTRQRYWQSAAGVLTRLDAARTPRSEAGGDAQPAPVDAQERPSAPSGDDHRPRHASVHVAPRKPPIQRFCTDPSCPYMTPHRRHY